MVLAIALAWLVLNVATATVYGYDKRQARRDGRRVSERALLTLALVGGAVGAWLAMRVARHKTRKAVFRVMVPVLVLLQLGAATAWVWLHARGSLLGS